MKFMFVCGGTAGHINPALAVAGKLKEWMPDAEFLFVGTGRELEKKLITQAGYPLETITIRGFSRGFSAKSIQRNFRLISDLRVSNQQAREILERFKPNAVIGTGGYVCYPMLKRASSMGIPTVLHESNAVPGLTTKMLMGKVDRILVAFPDAAKAYRRPEKVVVTGTPVRGDFAQLTKAEAKLSLGVDNRPYVVSFWGSLGASRMNQFMTDFILRNAESKDFYHTHSTGGGEKGLMKLCDRLRERGLTKLPRNIDLRSYIDNMGTVMTAADIVLCRAGASTVAELTRMGVPAVLVPSPNVTNNHQMKNARAVEHAGGAVVIPEEECSGEKLYHTVLELTNDKKRLAAMSEASGRLGVPDSCDKIAEIVLSLVN